MEELDERADELLHGLRLAHVGSAVDQLLVDSNRLTVVVEPTKGAPRAGKVVR